jgi:protein involved in polysaccharide export with SLBB domain
VFNSGGVLKVMRFSRLVFVFIGLVTLAGLAQAQQPRYVLQPGDTLDISVLQDPTLNRKIVIGPDGTISFPLAGHIRAARSDVPGPRECTKAKIK